MVEQLKTTSFASAAAAAASRNRVRMQLVKSHNNRLNEQMSFVEHGARKDPHGPTPLTSVAAYLSAFATVNCYPSTPLQYPTQVRVWILFKISLGCGRQMLGLPENAKIKIPQVGNLTNKFQK